MKAQKKFLAEKNWNRQKKKCAEGNDKSDFTTQQKFN